MEAVTDASHLYEVERRLRHAERPGFRISELTINPAQQVPWHYHTRIQDTFDAGAGACGWRRRWARPRGQLWMPAVTRDLDHQLRRVQRGDG